MKTNGEATANDSALLTALVDTLDSLSVFVSEEGTDRTNLRFMELRTPRLLADTIAAIKATDRKRRYLWSNVLHSRVYTSTRCPSLVDAYEATFRNWIRAIAFTEEIYPTAEQDSTWTEHQLSNAYLCAARLVGSEPEPMILATLLYIRTVQMSGLNYDLTEKEATAAISVITENFEAILPIIPELILRKDASQETIEMLLNGVPAPLLTGSL